MFFFVQLQQKVKNLRQSYEKARDQVGKSGQSSDVVYKICQYYDQIDLFMRDKPLSRPHFVSSTNDDTNDEDADIHPIPVEVAMPDLPAPNTPDDKDDNVEPLEEDQGHNEKEQVSTTPKIPGKNIRRKRSAGGSQSLLDEAESMLQEQKEFAAKSDKMLAEHLAFQKQKYAEQKSMLQEDREVMKSWMQQQKDESKGFLTIMGEMVGILKNMQSTQPSHNQPQWNYVQGSANNHSLGYAGDYMCNSGAESTLQFHQL